MLLELRIRNYALIDELTLELGPGLVALTGETGAGKSIVVGALSLLLGARASAEVVRVGAERAQVEGVFAIAGRTAVLAWLDEQGLQDDDGWLVVRREVTREGRSRAWIGTTPVPAASLAELGERLVALHGQHEHQRLLRREVQREILDAFAGHEALVAEVARRYESARRASEARAALEARVAEALARAEELRARVEEIERVRPRPGELDELEAEERRLSHVEELLAGADRARRALQGDHGVLDVLRILRRTLEGIARLDPTAAEWPALLDAAMDQLLELAERVERYSAELELDPERLEGVRRRLDLLARLARKYGPTLEDVLATAEQARRELALVDSGEAELEAAREAEAAARRALAEAAGRLRVARQEAAQRLSREVSALLPDLGLSGRFEVALLPLEAPSRWGTETVEFRAALNRGQPLRPLATVASGGELSRLMLALETLLARADAVPTLVFDEVDAGIGGRVAVQVARLLRRVAEHHQVLVITHLPQIASRAQQHLHVAKEDVGDATITRVRALDGEDRAEEIARMLGGDADSPASLQHARALLQGAES